MTYQRINIDMGIKRLYYEVFADAIQAAANNKDALYGPKEQQFYTLLIFSLAQYLNFSLMMLILTGLGINMNLYLHLNIFPGKIIDGFLSGFVSLVFPLMLINYFLVFHKKTYLKYKVNRKIKTKGWALMIYFMGSAMAFILYIVAGKWVL